MIKIHPHDKKRAYRPFFHLFAKTIALFNRRPLVINKNEVMEPKAIIISNHSGAAGPMKLAMFFPTFFVPWVAAPMTENYRNRWRYLYHVFYRQKLGYSKIKSWFLATFFGLISIYLYIGMRAIPTYTDLRLMTTVKISSHHLKLQRSILVFPEDSTDGYHEVLQRYNEGFVFFAQYYLEKHGDDLPIYPVYYSKKDRAMIIDKPQYISELIAKGLSREAMAAHFLAHTNKLRDEMLVTLKKITKE